MKNIMKRTFTLSGSLKVLILLGLYLLKSSSGSAQCTYTVNSANCYPTFQYSYYYYNSINIACNGTTFSSPLAPSSTTATYFDSSCNYGFSVTAGASYPISISPNTANSAYGYMNTGCWVDWNQDGNFDTTEFVGYYDMNTGNTPGNINMFVPGNQQAGTYRMRFIVVYGYYYCTPGLTTNGYNARSACTSFTGALATTASTGAYAYYGTGYDLSLNVVNNYTCYPPFNVGASSVGGNYINVSWTPSQGSSPIGWQTAVLPAGGTIGVTTPTVFHQNVAYNLTSDSLGGLTANTNYCVYVRAYCGSGPTDTSIWTPAYCFTTLAPPCSSQANAPIISTPATAPICLGNPYTILANGNNPGVSSIQYQWQWSTGGPYGNCTATTLGACTGYNTLSLTFASLPQTSCVNLRISATCPNAGGPAVSGIYQLCVASFNVPYSEDFYSTASGAEPNCYKWDVDPGNHGFFQVQQGYSSANGTHIAANVCPFNNTATTPAQLSAYFTVPGLNLIGGNTYTISFDYSRSNTAFQPHLQLYANTSDPGTTYNLGSTNVTGGTLLLDSTVYFNDVRHTCVTFVPPVGGTYYFSWYTNTTEAANIAYGTALGISNVNIYVANTCTTPTTQGTSLVGSTNINSVALSWTLSSPRPDKYLIVRTSGNTPLIGSSTIAPPYVGQAYGNGQIVAAVHGNSYTDQDLVANTTYTYTILAFNDLCTGPNCYGGPNINTTNPLTGTYTTTGAKIYVWNRTVSADFNTATNWTPNRTIVDQSDILVFSNSVADTAINVPNQVIQRLNVINNTTVRLWAAAGGSTLRLASDGDSTTNELTINAGSILYLDGSANAFTLAYSGTGATGNINGVLEMVETGAQNLFDCTGAITTVSANGSLNEGGTAGIRGILSYTYTLIVNGTVNFKYTTTQGPALPYATWNVGSNMLISGYTTANTAPGGATYSSFVGGFGQTFYNFTFNCAGLSAAMNWSGAAQIMRVTNNFTVASTGTGSLTLSTTSTPMRMQLNNYVQTGGTVYISNATAAVASTINAAMPQYYTSQQVYHLMVAGNFNMTGGIFGVNQTTTYTSYDYALSFNGSGTQNVNFSANPVGTLTYRIINPNGINLTTSNGLTTLTVNPGGAIRVSNQMNNPINTSVPIAYNYLQTGTIPNTQPSSLVYDSASGGSVISATVWPATNGPLFVVVNVGENEAITMPFSRTLSYTSSTAGAGCGILKLYMGDLDIQANTLTLGVNTSNYGQLYCSPTSVIRTLAGGTLTRWFAANTMPTSFASASATGNAIGYFPLAAGGAPRFVQLFGSTSTLTAGTVSVTHQPLTLLTPVSVADGAYNIAQRTNANWSISVGNGFTFAGTYNLRLNAANLFTSPTPANLRVMNASSVAGTYVSGGSLTFNTLPYYYAQRSALTTAQLTAAAWYIGAAAADINTTNIWTAINTGNWNTATTWDQGTVPPATAWCYINPGVNVTVGSSSDVGKYLVNNGTLTVSNNNTRLTIDSFIINNGTINLSGGTTDSLVVNGSYTINRTFSISQNNYGTINLAGGVLKFGPDGGGRVPFQNYGTLRVSGGILAMNGTMNFSLYNSPLSYPANFFIQTGGLIRIDINPAGNTSWCPPSGTIACNFGTNLNMHLTGGTLMFVDPSPLAASSTLNSSYGYSYTLMQYTGSYYLDYNITKPHTIQFGDGISTDPGGSEIGFAFYSYIYLRLGNVVAYGGNSSNYGTKRSVSWSYYLRSNGKITVMPNSTMGGYYNNLTGYYPYSLYAYWGDSVEVKSTGKLITYYIYFNPYTGASFYNEPATYHAAIIDGNANQTFGGMYPAYNPVNGTYWPNYTVSSATAYLPASYFWYQIGTAPVMLGNIRMAYYNYVAPLSVYGSNANYNARPVVVQVPPVYNSVRNYFIECAGCNWAYGYTPSQTNGWINGFHQKHANAGALAHTYYVGDSAWYTPVAINSVPGYSSITTGGDIAVKSTPGIQAHLLTNQSGLNPNKTLARYYSIDTVNGIQTAASSLAYTFNWVPGDNQPGALTYNYICAWDSTPQAANGTWHTYAWPWSALLGTVTATQTTVTNVSKLKGDYVFGEPCPRTIISLQPQTQATCSNVPVSFSVSAGGLGLTYQWYKVGVGALSNGGNISGATSSVLQLASATINDTGCYYVKISSTCYTQVTSATACLSITQAAVITSFSTDTNICVGQCFTLTGTGIGNAPLQYKWYKDGQLLPQYNNATSINICNASLTNSGIYTMTLTNSCRTDSTIPGANVTVHALPPAAITPQGPATFCTGDSVTFLADTLGAAANNYTFTWYYNTTQISGANSFAYTAHLAGGYYIKTTDVNGCSSNSGTDSVTLLSAPTATITAGSATAFCVGGSVTLTANAGLGYSYQWWADTGTGYYAINGSTTISIVASHSGNYKVVVNNAGGCTATSNIITVTVNEPPTVTVAAAGPTSFCQGGTVGINATVLPAGTYNYAWHLNGTGSYGTNANYTANQAGTWTVTVTDPTTGCSALSSGVVVTVNALPTATATAVGPTAICPGGSVTIDANTGTGLTYAWHLNGSPSAFATTASVTVTGAGTYTVTVTNANGCTATSTGVAVTVNPANISITSSPSPATVCSGTPVALTANPTTGYTYQWYTTSAAITGATANNYTANNSGTYYVVGTNATGCTATSNNIVVSILPLPVAVATALGNTTFCNGDSVKLAASPYGAPGYTYEWYNGATLVGSTDTITVSNAGTYDVFVSNASCTSAASNTITVTPLAYPSVNVVAGSSLSICKNGPPVTLTANVLPVIGAPGYTYTWLVDTGTGFHVITGATTNVLNAHATGNYEVYVANQAGCNVTSTGTHVFQNPAPTYHTSGPTEFCSGSNVTLFANGGPGANLSYQWYRNGVQIPGATDSFALVYPAGQYYCMVTVLGSCYDSTGMINIIVDTLPYPSIGYDAVNNKIVATAGYNNYTWFVNNNIIPGQNGSSITPPMPGDYKVMATNARNCNGYSTVLHYLNDNGVNNNIAAGDIHIYPNPASSIIHIDAPLKVTVIISSLEGKVVMKQVDATTLDISTLPNAVYLIKVYDADGALLKIDKMVKNGQ